MDCNINPLTTFANFLVKISIQVLCRKASIKIVNAIFVLYVVLLLIMKTVCW